MIIKLWEFLISKKYLFIYLDTVYFLSTSWKNVHVFKLTIRNIRTSLRYNFAWTVQQYCKNSWSTEIEKKSRIHWDNWSCVSIIYRYFLTNYYEFEKCTQLMPKERSKKLTSLEELSSWYFFIIFFVIHSTFPSCWCLEDDQCQNLQRPLSKVCAIYKLMLYSL